MVQNVHHYHLMDVTCSRYDMAEKLHDRADVTVRYYTSVMYTASLLDAMRLVVILFSQLAQHVVRT
jgi:hypothetical protein